MSETADFDFRQSMTACCPRETIPDSCSCPDGCGCMCLDCECANWGDDGYDYEPAADSSGDDAPAGVLPVRTASGPGPLPPLPDSAYPPGAMPLETSHNPKGDDDR